MEFVSQNLLKFVKIAKYIYICKIFKIAKYIYMQNKLTKDTFIL